MVHIKDDVAKTKDLILNIFIQDLAKNVVAYNLTIYKDIKGFWKI